MWTMFWDMHSGGGTKIPPYEKIYIEAPLDDALRVFQSKFNENPYEVACECCGQNYSVSEYPDLLQASGYHRNCKWSNKENGYIEGGDKRYLTIEEYEKLPYVKIIRQRDIYPHELLHELPERPW